MARKKELVLATVIVAATAATASTEQAISALLSSLPIVA